jgi:hypothetical protein
MSAGMGQDVFLDKGEDVLHDILRVGLHVSQPYLNLTHRHTLLHLHAAEDGVNLQSWLLCVEMLPAAVFMLFAFPWSEYVVAGGNISGGNITHAISIRWERGELCKCASTCRTTSSHFSAWVIQLASV